jgi:hypothetical protein
MTTSKQKGSTIFYGWWVVLASGVGLALHIGPIIVATFGVFLKPLSQEFGWSRAQISLAFSLATLGATAVHRPTGGSLWRTQGDPTCCAAVWPERTLPFFPLGPVRAGRRAGEELDGPASGVREVG